MCAINTIIKEQIKSLFSQAYASNFAMLSAALLVWSAIYFQSHNEHINIFLAVTVFAAGIRLWLTHKFSKTSVKHHLLLANIYSIVSLVIGCAFAFITVVNATLESFEIRVFLTIVNLGLVTAAISTLAVWLRAYYFFSIPQFLSLFYSFGINNSIYGVLSVFIYALLMYVVAKNFNNRFIDFQILLNENESLINKMEKEIESRKDAQNELENYKSELEDIVEEKTRELMESNLDLTNQITKRKDAEKELEHLAYYDVLTNLPNRFLLIERLKQAIHIARRNENLFSVIFIDLDRFKTINDSLGHSVGDKLIKHVGDRLKNTIRESDTVARNGSDEFVVIAENLSNIREALIVAEKLIDSICKTFEIDGHEIHIGASVGLSVFPFDADDALELLKMSDTAMYCAKEKGSNLYEFYSNEMSNQIKDRLKLEYALRGALENNEFYLVYQPQVEAENKQTTGFEALLRWNSPDLGMVSPGRFIPVLEETGLIYNVGEWIIQSVIEFIQNGHNRGKKVSINLSSLQCGIPRYSEKIKRYIADSGIDPSQLEFELTESIMVNDFEKTQKFLTDIHTIGCAVALDDFGTGYTSFNYLSRLPIDVIKIDRSLVTGIEYKKNLQNIVKAIVTMSESLGIENVFEGVETQQELEMVQSLHGHIIQGYLFSKPLEINQLDDWFDENQLAI